MRNLSFNYIEARDKALELDAKELAELRAELKQRSLALEFGPAQPVQESAVQGGDYVEYKTGAKRSERMPRYDLVVQDFIRRVAKRSTGEIMLGGPTGGALKYGEGNWTKGLPTSDVINHISHHLSQLLAEWHELITHYAANEGGPWPERMQCVRRGMNTFLEKDDHIGAIGWGLMVLCHQLYYGFHHDPAFEKEDAREHAEQAVPDSTRARQPSVGLGNVGGALRERKG